MNVGALGHLKDLRFSLADLRFGEQLERQSRASQTDKMKHGLGAVVSNFPPGFENQGRGVRLSLINWVWSSKPCQNPFASTLSFSGNI
jgi:hypothetical protein